MDTKLPLFPRKDTKLNKYNYLEEWILFIQFTPV